MFRAFFSSHFAINELNRQSKTDFPLFEKSFPEGTNFVLLLLGDPRIL